MAPREKNIVDRLAPQVIYRWLPEALLAAAREDVERGRVSRPSIGDTAVDAVVAAEDRRRYRVRIEWGADGPASSCACGVHRDGACRHAAALALLLVAGALPPRALDTVTVEPERPVQDEERRLREERGASELFEIRPVPGTRVLGGWQVASPSSRAYQVTLRALDGPHNGCTCPDFETNLLGTCKHIEAVLHTLRLQAPRRFEAAARSGPARSYLHLAFPEPACEPEPRLRLRPGEPPRVRRIAARYFGGDGRLLGPLPALWPELLRDLLEADVEVPPEVARLAERLREQEERAARIRAVEAEVKQAGPEPAGFQGRLYPYQVEGVAFLVARGRALLADDMGLGKTAQAIAALVRMLRSGAVRRVLVVCPASLKHQWARETARFAGLAAEDIAVVQGAREARRLLYARAAPVLITSYELARLDERDLEGLAPDLLILDEAQRIRNWRTRTAAAVKRIPSRHVFVLTGTPLENRLDDLYSILQVVDPHVLGPLWRFQDEFTERDRSGRPVRFRRLDELRRRVAPVLLRRRREEVLDELPERIVNRLRVPMTTRQRDLHDEAAEWVARLLAVLKKRPLTPREEQLLNRAFQRMRMACDAAGLVDRKTPGGPKLEELASLLEEIAVEGGRKVVVFSEWERMQELAAGVCRSLRLGHVRLHGGVPSGARGALIDRFRDDPACQVFLSTDAGGVGLNLQVASHVINLDLPWNPAVLAQRIARVHRLGQREPVSVVLMVSEGSFEERLELSLDAKRALFAAAVGDDQETTELERTTLAGRIATLMGGEFAAETGKRPGVDAEPAASGEQAIAALREKLGAALERVLRLPDGRLLGVVRGGAAPPADAAGPGALLLPAPAVEAMAVLGETSPLAGAPVLYVAEAGPADPLLAARRDLVGAAERKLAAARALLAAGMGGEALGLLHAATGLACRSLVAQGDPGEGAPLLAAVYGRLLPAGVMGASDAHLLVRAGELARAFAGHAMAPPDELVAEVAREGEDLVARARGLAGERS